MPKEKTKPDGLKISELARRAGVPVPTIKYYLSEGLLPKPVKTGRTMSYYDPGSVERLRIIKRLQSERFLPLSIIKKLVESGVSLEAELALGDALMGAVPPGSGAISRKRIASHTGYPLSKIDRIEEAGLLHPGVSASGKEYDAIDCRIISLIRQREEAGLPFEYSLEMMSVYLRHIDLLVKDDLALFVRRMLKNSSAENVAQYIREGDRALSAFMPLIKAKLVVSNAEAFIEEINGAPGRIYEGLTLGSTYGSRDFGKREAGPVPWDLLVEAFKGRTSRNTVVSDSAWFNLLCGLGNLCGREPGEALGHLRRSMESAAVGALAASLAGLAHIGLVEREPGILGPMRMVTEALACFDESRRRDFDAEVAALVSYFRGVGLSALPQAFDTRREAIADLSGVVEAGSPSRSVGRRGKGPRMRLLEKLSEKARHFLAEMKGNSRGTTRASSVTERG